MEPVTAFVGGPVSLDGVAGLLLMGGTDVNPKCYGAERQPEMLPEEILGGRRECNQHDRQNGRPHAPVLPVDPEVPVAHGQHGVDMIATDHDQKQKRQDQKIGGPDGIRRLGAVTKRRTRHSAGAGAARRRRDLFGRRSRSGLN